MTYRNTSENPSTTHAHGLVRPRRAGRAASARRHGHARQRRPGRRRRDVQRRRQRDRQHDAGRERPDDGAPDPTHPEEDRDRRPPRRRHRRRRPRPADRHPGTFATNDGGSVTIEADGDFSYTPAPATSCTDTSDFFDYTVTDRHRPPEPTDTGRVTIQIAGCVWYVSNNAPGQRAAPRRAVRHARAGRGRLRRQPHRVRVRRRQHVHRATAATATP